MQKGATLACVLSSHVLVVVEIAERYRLESGGAVQEVGRRRSMALDSISKRLAEWYSSNTITRHPPRTLSFTLLQHGNEWKNSTLQQVNSRPVSYACT